jgi:hypothetical protein
VAIPESYDFLGTGVDFIKNNILLEVQFSNYPFLLNNVVRTYLFNKQRVRIGSGTPEALIIITKCKIFPASNSTLYYEQGEQQLSVLASPNVFNLPVRLVGLSEEIESRVPCIFTTYASRRYSRDATDQQEKSCYIKRAGARAKLELE